MFLQPQVDICHEETLEGLLHYTMTEAHRLAVVPQAANLTVLIVVPSLLNDFFDYKDFMGLGSLRPK